MFDDEHDGLKSRPARIVSGIVNNDLAVVAHRIDLLQAAVPAAHARCHNHKDGFLIHNSVPFLYSC